METIVSPAAYNAAVKALKKAQNKLMKARVEHEIALINYTKQVS
jgi:hypothetical protein